VAQITNPAVIKFSNEVLRPMSERLRALKYTIDVELITFNSQILGQLASGADTIEDNRQVSGCAYLIAQDMISVMDIMAAIQTILSAGGVAQILSKPCVRGLFD
jgi:hypothetical protein